MNTPSPEQIEQARKWLDQHCFAMLGWIPAQTLARYAAHVQAQAAPLAQGLVDAGDAMRDELQKKVVLDRLTNDKFPGSAECAISRWTQAKVSSLPASNGEKERSGPSQ